MPNKPQRYHAYSWSAPQWPQQLYYPQYWAYPQASYPYAPYITPVGNYAQLTSYPSPGRREKRRSLTPPGDVETHPLLGGRYRPTAVWDISQAMSTALRTTSRGTLEPIPADELDRPATNPSAHTMNIVCDLFPWDIRLQYPRNEAVTVADVLDKIFATLQEPLDVEEWEEETSNNRRKMYRNMCTRLSREPPNFEVIGRLKRIDTLDKTYFLGLKPVGPAHAPEEWLLKLGSPPKEGRR